MEQCSTCGKWKNESEFRKYRRQCRDCENKYRRGYYKIHKEQEKEHDKEYYETHKKQRREYSREYRANHKEQGNEYYRKRMKNPKWKLNNIISVSMRYSLKDGKNGQHWESYVDFTQEDLMKHLESQFTSKMNWNNRGSYWHIDHKIPISVFNFDSPDHIDFKRCWTLKNLRPLEKTENMKKHNRIKGSFQPSLKV